MLSKLLSKSTVRPWVFTRFVTLLWHTINWFDVSGDFYFLNDTTVFERTCGFFSNRSDGAFCLYIFLQSEDEAMNVLSKLTKIFVGEPLSILSHLASRYAFIIVVVTEFDFVQLLVNSDAKWFTLMLILIDFIQQ